MPAFSISFMRVDRDTDPTIVESFIRSVEWPLLPREGEGVDLSEGDAATVESVGYDIDGYPNVFLGRIVLDDLRAAQLRKLVWHASPLPFGRRLRSPTRRREPATDPVVRHVIKTCDVVTRMCGEVSTCGSAGSRRPALDAVGF